MFRSLRRIFLPLIFACLLLATFCCIPSISYAKANQSDDAICTVYITGIGCHNCAIVDPVLFVELTTLYPNLVIFEYEIYQGREENAETKKEYFDHYWGPDHHGVPFLILDKENTAMGKFKVLKLAQSIENVSSNPFPLANGESVSLSKLDFAALPGKVNIWTKNRVLMTKDADGDSKALRRLLVEPDIRRVLRGVSYEEIEPVPVAISEDEIAFENAVQIGSWTLQWNGQALRLTENLSRSFKKSIHWVFAALVGLMVAISIFRLERTQKGLEVKLRQIKKKKMDYVAILGATVFLFAFFIFAKNASPDYLEHLGYKMPLASFTFFIALVDGFNPCNMFVLTCLMALLISTSDSRLRLYIVGLSFVLMVFMIYFLFMAAWLNVFTTISFIAPLRIAIAILALVAGVINCKELLFFKKGISLTISDQHRGPLMKKVYSMKGIIQKGSFPVLVLSSLALAALASLVELPCTAGFPIIYTGILSSKVLESSFSYYAYLLFYTSVYVMPLVVIISIFILAFKGQPISQRQMEILKFIGGLIMILLGIILLVNPQLVGLGL
ncbi:MAG: hypothetical protein P9M07_07775 [Candidatus Aceula meridiana]|nr:hypothetical protein [Candidatus Aceula meridiana]